MGQRVRCLGARNFDLFECTSIAVDDFSEEKKDALTRNRTAAFEDVTESHDKDGYEDLYVTAYGGNKLCHNNGDGTFSDVTEKAGVVGSGW